MAPRLKLEIQLIPRSSWGVSLANLLPKERWDKFRREVYKDADYTCTICSCDYRTFHAHEVWVFNDTKLTQKLKDVLCVCKLCHDCIHYGRSSQVYGPTYLNVIRKHIMELNKWTKEDLDNYISKQMLTHKKRANKEYKVIVGKKELFIA